MTKPWNIPPFYVVFAPEYRMWITNNPKAYRYAHIVGGPFSSRKKARQFENDFTFAAEILVGICAGIDLAREFLRRSRSDEVA